MFSSGWASGVNAYLVVLVLGIADRVGDFADIPDALGRWEVLAVAAFMYVMEFVADKIPYVDSTWDVISTAIRPTVGAIVGVLIAGDADSLSQAAGAVVGGGTALASHAVKAGSRLAVNSSPEPVTNIGRQHRRGRRRPRNRLVLHRAPRGRSNHRGGPPGDRPGRPLLRRPADPARLAPMEGPRRPERPFDGLTRALGFPPWHAWWWSAAGSAASPAPRGWPSSATRSPCSSDPRVSAARCGRRAGRVPWDAGPTHTLLPAVVRDLFRKSGRPLERRCELVPLERGPRAPVRRRHVGAGCPAAVAAAQIAAFDEARARARASAWVDVRRRRSPTTGRRCAATTSSSPGAADAPPRELAALPRQPRDAAQAAARRRSRTSGCATVAGAPARRRGPRPAQRAGLDRA